jgi:hypothetical protein
MSQIAIAVRPAQSRGCRWPTTGVRQPLGRRLGLDEFADGPIQVRGSCLGEHLFIPVAQGGPELGVELAVLLRVGASQPVARLPVAAVGERVELAGTLDPVIPQLGRRPELQRVAHCDHIRESTGDQQRIERSIAGGHDVAQPEAGPGELGRRISPYERLADLDR